MVSVCQDGHIPIWQSQWTRFGWRKHLVAALLSHSALSYNLFSFLGHLPNQLVAKIAPSKKKQVLPVDTWVRYCIFLDRPISTFSSALRKLLVCNSTFFNVGLSRDISWRPWPVKTRKIRILVDPSFKQIYHHDYAETSGVKNCQKLVLSLSTRFCH